LRVSCRPGGLHKNYVTTKCIDTAFKKLYIISVSKQQQSTEELKMIESKRVNGVYLKTTDGIVYEISYEDLVESDEICSPKKFLEALQNGERAIAFFDGWNEEIYDQIERDYGINQ
jgi:hypothetical protein